MFPAPQQPTAILQQLPATMMPPGLAPSIRPGGHVKEVTGKVKTVFTGSSRVSVIGDGTHRYDSALMASVASRLAATLGDTDLVELMMIQNAQMHQVIMNNMTMSALRSFGYADPPPGPEAPRDVVIIDESEADPEVYHHYYQPAPCLSYPPWLLPQATLVYQEDPGKPGSAPPHSHRPAVPPPSPPPPPPPHLPPSTTATEGANVAPAAENNNAGDAEAEKKRW